MKRKEKALDVRKLTIIGILGAITAVLGSTPIGFIPIGPTRATIMHIPVIIGAIMEGPLVGGFVGLIFGLFSIFQAVTAPTPVSFAFINPLVSVLPRILIGVISYYAYKGLRTIGNKGIKGILYVLWLGIILYLSYGIYTSIANGETNMILINVILLVITISLAYFTMTRLKTKALDIIMATIAGTLTNTLGVLTMIYLLYAERFVSALGQNAEFARNIIFGIGLTNGIPEVIIAIIIVTSVVTSMKRQKNG